MDERILDRKQNIQKKNDTNNKRPVSDTGHSLAILIFKAQWLLYVPPGGTVCSAHTVYLRVLQGSRPALHSINCLVFITETVSVYCAVRTGSLNKAVCASSLTF